MVRYKLIQRSRNIFHMGTDMLEANINSWKLICGFSKRPSRVRAFRCQNTWTSHRGESEEGQSEE